MDKGEKPLDLMVVIAAVPDPAKQGAVELKQVLLRDIEKFKSVNPVHSFLLPPGSGRIRLSSGTSVAYAAQPAGDGKVLVKTEFHQEMGGLVVGHYEATEKTVDPKFTNTVQWMVAIITGLWIASLLHIIGRVLRYWSQRERHA